jgi:hypothetical protein
VVERKKKTRREVRSETIKSRRVICSKRSRAFPRMDVPIDTIAMDTRNRLALEPELH